MSKVVLKRPTTSGKTLPMIKKINKKNGTLAKKKLVKKVAKKPNGATKKKVVKKTTVVKKPVVKKPKKQAVQNLVSNVLETPVVTETELPQTELNNEIQA